MTENHGVPGSSPGPATLVSSHVQEKPLPLFVAALMKRGIHHNGHSLEALREEVVEVHGGLAMHGGETWV